MELSLQQQYRIRKGALWTERATWDAQYRDLSQFFLPRTGRFMVTDRNKGDKRYGKIINETATRALRVLAAGLMAGMTSPARPWFRLATPDRSLMAYTPVKSWLNDVTELMRDIFARSNTYRALHSVYEELGLYGTAADIVLDDFADVIRHYVSTCGEYGIAADYRGEVNTLYREFDMTVATIVAEFVRPSNRKSGSMDWSVVSPMVKNLWDGGRGLDSWITVMHVIEPREDRDTTSKLAKDMRFASCYLESGANVDKFLRESGFPRFPALCPRWHTSGGDIMGNSPGMEALGSTKQLQHGESRKSLAIDYGVKPPLQIPTQLKNMPLSTLPGGVMYHDSTGPQNMIRSMFEPKLNIADQRGDIDAIERRINQTMYVDLFLMLAQDDRSGTTAREIAERHEEKLLMLGPVLERLHNELLKPYIDVVFDRMIMAGIVPPPPEELHGMELQVEFVSMLAQAQRAVGVSSVDRLIQTIGTIATFQHNAGMPPTAMDKLNVDTTIDRYSDYLAADPDMIVGNEQVAIIRQERAQAQAKAQAVASIPAAAGAAKDLSQSDPNKIKDLLGQFSGYSGISGNA